MPNYFSISAYIKINLISEKNYSKKKTSKKSLITFLKNTMKTFSKKA